MQLRSQCNLDKYPIESLNEIIRKLLSKVTRRKTTKLGQIGVDKIVSVEGKYFVKRGPVPISQNDLLWLTDKARDQFQKGQSLIRVQSPVVLVGDIHGQYNDLVMIFDHLKHPPHRKYLFLGDYVDRGLNSLETISLIFAYALRYPQLVYVLRGNHELLMINLIHGFKQECNQRMSDEVFDRMNDAFDSMPLAAVVDDEIFCCHGGLGPHLLKSGLKGIESIQRPLYPQGDCLAIDLLWADPSGRKKLKGFRFNDDRGISYKWGMDVIENFLTKYGLTMIVRAHQAVSCGYQQHLHPFGFTVFSAPNYMGNMQNEGAVMMIQDSDQGPRISIVTFNNL